MRIQLRLACVAIVVFALAGACSSKDNSSATTSTSSPVTSSLAGNAGPVTSSGGATSQNVQDGALCTTPSARGTTASGQVMTCTLVGAEYHWRPS